MVKGLTAAPASPFHLKEVQAPSGYVTDEKEHEFKTDPLVGTSSAMPSSTRSSGRDPCPRPAAARPVIFS